MKLNELNTSYALVLVRLCTLLPKILKIFRKQSDNIIVAIDIRI